MPILQPDEWRKPFFETEYCPENVIIPTKDPDAYQMNPQHNWAYNKLFVAEKQSIPCGPHGTAIPSYPAFSKPIYNLRSMGAGIEILNNDEHYRKSLKPGYMWSELLIGEHYSTDAAVSSGKVLWIKHTRGIPLDNGTFDYWELKENPYLDDYLVRFIEAHFTGYSGMLNLETIGNKIIEVHLRFADQWPDLYGKWFVSSLIDLYTHKSFTVGEDIKNGYSVVLFDQHRLYRKPEKTVIETLLAMEGISSIQLPFHEGIHPSFHSMPPGGFRIGIINGFDLEACKNARIRLKKMIEESTYAKET
jgi:hypothetical protein